MLCQFWFALPNCVRKLRTIGGKAGTWIDTAGEIFRITSNHVVSMSSYHNKQKLMVVF
jgi:hypothetical protein